MNPNELKTRYPNGRAESKITYANGKKNGLGIEWYESGAKHHEEAWVDGKPHGVWGGWDEDGRKWYERMWVDGNQWSFGTYWHGNGEKKFETLHLKRQVYANIEWDAEGNVIKTDFPIIPANPREKPHKTTKTRDTGVERKSERYNTLTTKTPSDKPT